MPRLALPDPPGLPWVLTRQEALEAGLTDSAIRHRVRTGRWWVLAPAIYATRPSAIAEASAGRFEAAREDYRLRVAAQARRRPHAVVGGVSVAVLRGLPLVTGLPAKSHLLVPDGRWSGTVRTLQVHQAHHLAEDTESIVGPDGQVLLVTSVARTWVDIARSRPLADALSVGDAALRLGLMTVEDAASVLDRLGPVRGSRRAWFALAHITPLRESPLESGSGARFIEWQFPPPRLQQDWFDDHGFIARSDADWEEFAVIGFADGRGKYGLDPQRDRIERAQESRLRPRATVARWGWIDIAGTGIGLFRLLAPLLRIERPFPRVPVIW